MVQMSESVESDSTVRNTHSEYSEICLPNDANMLGNMLGGRVMHLVDLCGAIAGMRHARGPVVTASVDQMTFLHPIPDWRAGAAEIASESSVPHFDGSGRESLG